MCIKFSKVEKDYIKYLYSASRQYGFTGHDRLNYTLKWFLKEFSLYNKNPKGVYLAIEDLTNVLQPISQKGKQNEYIR